MNGNEKIFGEERRQYILNELKNSTTPITGGDLAKMTKVSRQVIVGDITLLKARNEPIMATNRGYLYLQQQNKPFQIEKVIACNHTPTETEEELNILVDNGVTVKDVKIEHSVYGDLTASIMVSNRNDVKNFIKHINETNASFLLELTGGIHLHTLVADSEKEIQAAEEALKKANILVE